MALCNVTPGFLPILSIIHTLRGVLIQTWKPNPVDYPHMLEVFVTSGVSITETKKEAHTLRAGFEPTRGYPIGFQVQRLNHSAIAANVTLYLKESQEVRPTISAYNNIFCSYHEEILTENTFSQKALSKPVHMKMNSLWM